MKQYFLVKIKRNDAGKTISEQYLLDAIGFSDAEFKINSEIDDIIEVVSIQKYKLNEIFLGDGDKYFRVKVSFILDDEKKTSVFMLVYESDIKKAEELLRFEMNGTLSDYEISAIVETKIIDLFQFD